MPGPGGGPESLLFVFARAADAVRRAGGTIAMAVDAGATVTVLVGVHDVSTGGLDAAMRALGVGDHRVLGGANARRAGMEPRRYAVAGEAGSLVAAEQGEVAADIATVISALGATTVVGDDPDSDDADAAASARAARRAATVMGAEYRCARDDAAGPADESVEVGALLARKRDALRRLGDDPTAATTTEWFSADADEAGEDRPAAWADFGVRGRIVFLVAALLLGAVVGALGTVVFQVVVPVGDATIPIGLAGALAVTAAVLIGLRLVFETRLITAAAALGLLGVTGLFSMESPGGSVLIPDAPLSYFWIYGPPVIAFLVLAWPDLRRAPQDVRTGSADPARVRIAEASNRKEDPHQ